jgi:hypothetical protein
MAWSARRRAGALLTLGSLAYAGAAIASLRDDSQTFDEGVHLAAGYTYLRFRDYRLNPEHPPLLKMLSALPLLLVPVRFDPGAREWRSGQEWQVGHLFLYRWNDAERLLLRARLPTVALGIALAAAVFFWTRRHWGEEAAALAFALTLLNPDVLAHGRLVTTDVGFTLLFFLTVVCFERATDRLTWGRAIAFGLALGAACCAKFSAVALGPVLLGLGLVVVLQGPIPVSLGAGPAVLGSRRARAVGVGLLLAAGAVVASLCVWAAYGFVRRAPDVAAPLPVAGPWGPLLGAGERLGFLPAAFVSGFATFAQSTTLKPAFLLGAVSLTGWPHYFLVTFLVKTPPALLLLLLLSLLTLGRHHSGMRGEWFLIVPTLVYAALAVTRAFNIGHRHLLPLYPFLFVFAGRFACLLRRTADGTGRPGEARPIAAVLGLLLAGHVWSTASIHPHYLAYFNSFVGGPSEGWRVLVDSNLDWGQDLKRLRDWKVSRGIPTVKLSYFGTADPAYYGFPVEHILPSLTDGVGLPRAGQVQAGDWVAVSATNLQGLYLGPDARPLIERLRRLPPVGNVGYSILLYRADFDWAPDAAPAREGGPLERGGP